MIARTCNLPLAYEVFELAKQLYPKGSIYLSNKCQVLRNGVCERAKEKHLQIRL